MLLRERCLVAEVGRGAGRGNEREREQHDGRAKDAS
jgi:hypothetical protein